MGGRLGMRGGGVGGKGISIRHDEKLCLGKVSHKIRTILNGEDSYNGQNAQFYILCVSHSENSNEI